MPDDVVRYGAYICLSSAGEWHAAAAAPVAELAAKFGFQNEFTATAGHPSHAIAFLHRTDAAAGGIADDALLHAHAIVHVASPNQASVADFCAEATRILTGRARAVVRSGVVRPTRYTSGVMHEFAYAHQLAQQPGPAMPHAFLLPLSKTAEWWAKNSMERNTYFLPRYDQYGRMLNEGHALSAAPGIPHLMRRTYRNATEPAPSGEYDFLNYFECADAGVPVFHAVCAALRDTNRNPEWRFVREGPAWHGRRVAAWADLFDRDDP